jgi:hypothetical protein
MVCAEMVMTELNMGKSLWDSQIWDSAFTWAEDEFGKGSFIAFGSVWKFYKKEDAMMFALKWS